MSDFDRLLKDLHLSSTIETQEQLNTLKFWCLKHISRDIVFDGTITQQYTQYCTLAKRYLDYFLTKTTTKSALQAVMLFHGMNAIQFAALKGYERFIMSLESVSGHDFDQPTPGGMPPLHIAAVNGYSHTFEALLEKGANPTNTNRQQHSPMHYAHVNRHCANALRNDKERFFKRLSHVYPMLATHQDKNCNEVDDNNSKDMVHVQSYR